MATIAFSQRCPYYAEGLSLPVTPASGYTPAEGDIVSIADDGTVSKSVDADAAVGIIRFANSGLGEYTCEFFQYRHLLRMVAEEEVTAGGGAKIGAPSGATQRVAAFVSGTDPAGAKIGVFWRGGAAGATVEVLV
jgi:hypothetical protein